MTRPVPADRLAFAAAIGGLLICLHLALQSARSFAGDCTGFDLAPSFDCAAVTSSAFGTLLGVSNVAWGAAFYGAAAALTAVAVLAPREATRTRSRTLRDAAAAVGLLYSAFLVGVQVLTLDALCLLCLASALAATTLALAAFRARRTLGTPPPRRRVVLRPAPALFLRPLAVGATLAVADLVLLGGAPPQAVAQAPRLTLAAPATCGFDNSIPRVPLDSLVGPHVSATGPPDAAVTLVSLFDPNCPHCLDFDPVRSAVAAAYSDRVRAVEQPFQLFRHSGPQIEALYEAARQGNLPAMAQGQFERQDPRNGLPSATLVQIAADAGLDADALSDALAQATHAPAVAAHRARLRRLGVQRAPSVFLDGRALTTASLSEDCLGLLLDDALASADSSGRS